MKKKINKLFIINSQQQIIKILRMESSSNLSQLNTLCFSIENNSIKVANLGSWKISDRNMQNLSNSLKKNNSIVSINLEKNLFGPLGVKALAEYLQTNSTLMYLDLSGNKLGNEGVSYLAEILKYNTSIRCLRLEADGIDGNGIIPLANSLFFNHSIEFISLSHNRINDLGISLLAKVLRYNSSITFINVNHNLYSQKGMMLLKNALEKNYSMLAVQNFKERTLIPDEVFFRNRFIYQNVFTYLTSNPQSFEKLNYFIFQKFHFRLKNADVLRYNLTGDYNSDKYFQENRNVEFNPKRYKDYFSQESKYMKMADCIDELISRKWFRLVGICKDFKMMNSDLRLSENILSVVGQFLTKADFLLIWELNKFQIDFKKLQNFNLWIEENIPFGKTIEDERKEILRQLEKKNPEKILPEKKQNNFKLKKWFSTFFNK